MEMKRKEEKKKILIKSYGKRIALNQSDQTSLNRLVNNPYGGFGALCRDSRFPAMQLSLLPGSSAVCQVYKSPLWVCMSICVGTKNTHNPVLKACQLRDCGSSK